MLSSVLYAHVNAGSTLYHRYVNPVFRTYFGYFFDILISHFNEFYPDSDTSLVLCAF